MSGFSTSYQSAVVKPSQVVANESLYNALEKLTDGKYNRGELVLKNNEFVAVNNHVHLTLLNGTTTTREENQNVRKALSEVLDNRFGGLGTSQTMAVVKERLLGADNRMMPISRDEVRCMINLLKKVSENYVEPKDDKGKQTERTYAERMLNTSQSLKLDASKIGEFRAGRNIAGAQDERALFGKREVGVDKFVKNYESEMVNTDTVNMSSYRAYYESREDLSRSLGGSEGPINDDLANRLADLAFSRSELYKDDKDFILLKQNFKEWRGEGASFTKMFELLRAKASVDLDKLDKGMLEKVAHERATKMIRYNPDYTVDQARESIKESLKKHIDGLEAKFRQLDGVEIQDGRVVGMEDLLDRKSSLLKKSLALLLSSGNMADQCMAGILNDIDSVEQKRQQQKEQVDQTEKDLSTTGADLKDQHADIVKDLDAWVTEMRNLSGDGIAQKVETINKTLKDENILQGSKFLIQINDGLLHDLTTPEHLLESKVKYVKAFKELSAMGFSDEVIGANLDKNVLLVAGSNDAMKLALRKIAASLPEKDGLAKIQNAHASAVRERAAIRKMMKLCTDFLTRLDRLLKGQNANDNFENLEKNFQSLVDVAKQRKDPLPLDDGTKMKEIPRFGVLSMKLPSFVKSLELRDAEVDNRIGYLEAGLGLEEPAAPDQPDDASGQPDVVTAKLWTDLRAVLLSPDVGER